MDFEEIRIPIGELIDVEEKLNPEMAKWLEKAIVLYSEKSKITELRLKRLEAVNYPVASVEDDKLPYYEILLVQAHILNGNMEEAEEIAKTAEVQFKIRGKFPQAAISSWILGLLQNKNGHAEAARDNINEIVRCLSKKHTESYERGNSEFTFKALAGKISNTWKSMQDQKTAHLPSAEQSFHRVQETDPPKRKSSAHKKADFKQQFRAFAKRNSWEHKKESYIPATKQWIIPQIPLYGTAKAGPDYPVLDPIKVQTIGPVGMNGMLRFNAKNHSVACNFKKLDLKHPELYGWFHVVGRGMNAAPDLPINARGLDEDLVLVELISPDVDISFHVGKIVIGTMKEPNASLKHIVVNRLVQKENLLFFRSEMCAGEPSIDKKTIKEDIEITNNVKILGVVIAVARPKR